MRGVGAWGLLRQGRLGGARERAKKKATTSQAGEAGRRQNQRVRTMIMITMVFAKTHPLARVLDGEGRRSANGVQADVDCSLAARVLMGIVCKDDYQKPLRPFGCCSLSGGFMGVWFVFFVLRFPKGQLRVVLSFLPL